jgi:hypothetical protein
MLKIMEGIYEFLTSDSAGSALTNAKEILMELKNDDEIKYLLGGRSILTTQHLFEYLILDRTKINQLIDVLESEDV